MQASQTQTVDEQMQVQDRDRWVPVPSQLELELRCRISLMEIDRRIEIQRSDEYRRMMLAMVGGGGGGGHYPGQLLPAPEPAPEREIMPVPGPVLVGGSSSSPSESVACGHPAALPVPYHGAVAQAGPATWERRLALPSSLDPSSSSSQLSDGSSSSRRGRGRAGRAGSSTRPSRRLLRLIDAESPRNALNDDDESRTGPASTALAVSQVSRVEGRQDQPRPRHARNSISAFSQPQTLRRVFRHSLANSIPSDPLEPQFDPHASAGGGRFGSRAAVDSFLRENGIEPSSQLAPQDAALADATPDVMPVRFTALFGGTPVHERPKSRARKVLSIDLVVQPYAPSSPGEPGVFFVVPGTEPFQYDDQSFSVFVKLSRPGTHQKESKYRYLGDYSNVPIARTTVEVEDWLSLPIRCRAAWSWRIFTSMSPEVRAIHARTVIRDTRRHGPLPSQGEIDVWLKDHPGRREGIKEANIFDVLNTGVEGLNCMLIRCIGYDIRVAMPLLGRIPQDHAQDQHEQ